MRTTDEGSTAEDRFVSLLLQHQFRLYSYVTVLLPCESDAEDVYQQACMKLWEKRAQFDPERDFLLWACGFARLEVLKYFERHRNAAVHLSPAMVDELAESQWESSLHFDARRNALAGCLEKLPTEQRHFVQRCYENKGTLRAIASQLRISVDALYKRLSRLRRILLECVANTLKAEDRL